MTDRKKIYRASQRMIGRQIVDQMVTQVYVFELRTISLTVWSAKFAIVQEGGLVFVRSKVVPLRCHYQSFIDSPASSCFFDPN